MTEVAGKRNPSLNQTDRYTERFNNDPRGIVPGPEACGVETGGDGGGDGGRPGAIRKGGVPRLDEPIGAAKADREAMAIMRIRITSIV